MLIDGVPPQVKNIEGDRVAMVRKKIETPSGPTSGAAVEYKEAEESDETAIDPNSVLLTQPQIESVVRDVPGIAEHLRAPALGRSDLVIQ